MKKLLLEYDALSEKIIYINTMNKRLRVFIFVTGSGCLISSGIYIYKLVSNFEIPSLVKAPMFLLAGIILMVIYGEKK